MSNRKAWASFIGLFFFLLIVSIVIQISPAAGWHSQTTTTHTLMQFIATILALFCGIAALYQYYKNEATANSMLIFIGVGFLGTAIIDAYHAIVTASWFIKAFPQLPSSIAEWSWLATRVFLSFLFILSLLFPTLGKERKINPSSVYASVSCLVVLTFALFLFIRTPYPVYPEQFIARPFELIPGLLFFIVLIGYLIEGSWKTNRLFFWLMMFLLISVATQFFYIDLCKKAHDTLYLTSHLLKLSSYAMVYIAISETA